MEDQLVKAVEGAIDRLVSDFQGNPSRFWNERDMHWSLFYYLKQKEVIQEIDVTQLVRAEFPTVKKYGEKNPARGHYDLAVLDPQSYNSPAVQSMKAQDSWDDFLKLVKVMVAVEVKLWLARLPLGRADWDIQKLTDSENDVCNAYFLNFIQLDFSRPRAEKYYQELRGCLMKKMKLPNLKILCVPSDIKVQPNPSENWLSPA
jgi:hypothetical protein